MQKYSSDNDNEGSNVPMGPYASLNEMAYQTGEADSARWMAETVRAALLEGTDVAVGDAQVCGAVSVLPGTAIILAAQDAGGTEFEIIVREKA